MKNLIDRNRRIAPWIAALAAGAISVLSSMLIGGNIGSEIVEAILVAVVVFAVVTSTR